MANDSNTGFLILFPSEKFLVEILKKKNSVVGKEGIRDSGGGIVVLCLALVT